MRIRKVFIQKVAPELGPEDQQLIVALEDDRYEAISIYWSRDARSLAYSLQDLAERLIRQSNEEVKK